MYINPEMFEKERSLRGEAGSTHWEKHNSEFEQHSRTARLFNKPELSDDLRRALETYKDYSKEDAGSATNVVQVNSSDINEDEVLG